MRCRHCRETRETVSRYTFPFLGISLPVANEEALNSQMELKSKMESTARVGNAAYPALQLAYE
jgi:hypothetical protein